MRRNPARNVFDLQPHGWRDARAVVPRLDRYRYAIVLLAADRACEDGDVWLVSEIGKRRRWAAGTG